MHYWLAVKLNGPRSNSLTRLTSLTCQWLGKVTETGDCSVITRGRAARGRRTIGLILGGLGLKTDEGSSMIHCWFILPGHVLNFSLTPPGLLIVNRLRIDRDDRHNKRNVPMEQILFIFPEKNITLSEQSLIFLWYINILIKSLGRYIYINFGIEKWYLLWNVLKRLQLFNIWMLV